jgi:hypothetical protein
VTGDEHGSIVLEHAGGEQLCLVEGAVFTVAPMRLLAIHNAGREPAVIALGRRRRVAS